MWDDARSNVALDAQVGNDREATAAAFARAAHVVKFETWIQRVTGVPMEPRAVVCEFDAKTQTLHACTRAAAERRASRKTSRSCSTSPAKDVRVLMHDVGGNFGTRGFIYPEFCLVAWAARRVGRPVKWTCTRQEAFLSDYQGRDLAVEAELALDARGHFPGDARIEHRQRRRAHRELLPAAQGRGDHVEHLPHAGRLVPRARGAVQHHDDPALSQLGAPGSDVRHGAADRPRRPRVRLRPHRVEAPQPADARRSCPTPIRGA